MPIGAMSIKITGDISDFNKNIANLQKQLNNSTKGLQVVARSMTTVGDSLTKTVTVPILAIGAGLLKLGSDFDDAYNKIRVGTGKTGDELKGLQDDFRAVAKVAPSAFGDISTAITKNSQILGLNGKALQDLSVQELNLSRITKTDLNANVDQAAKLFNNWEIATENQSKTLDLMYRASENTGIGITDLMTKVTDTGPILRAMGYDLETSIALIAGFDKAGVDVSSTIAGMKKALVTMAKEGMTDPQEVLKTYIDRIIGAKDSIEATAIAAELFGPKGGAAMAASIREGRLNLDDLVESLKTGTETINGAAKATDDWKEKLILLRNRLALKLEPLAAEVFDSLGRGIDKVTPKIEELADRFGKLTPVMQDNVIKWGLIVAIIPLVVSGFGRAATGAIALYKAIALLNTVAAGKVLIPLATAAGLTTAQLLAVVVAAPLTAKGLNDVTLSIIDNEKEGKNWFKILTDLLGVLSLNPQYLNKSMMEMLGWTKATEEATASTTAYDYELKSFNDFMSQSVKPTTDSKVAIQDHKNAIAALAATYPDLTAAQLEEKLAMDEGTESTDNQTDSVDKLRSAFNKLIDEIFGGITTYNDFQEANWAVEAAQKALTEAIKKYGEGSREAEQAQNDLDDVNITAIETAFKLSNQIGATTEQQEEAKQKAIELGLEYVNTGAISTQAFLDMALKFGLSSADIIAWADKENYKLDFLTRQRIITVETGRSISAVNLLEEALNRIHDVNKTVTITGVMAGRDLTHFMSGGGIVGFSQGGILDKILSASKGINLPKFDNGGVLAMLHPPEIVLNAKEAMQLVWNMATKPIAGGSSSNTNINIYGPVVKEDTDIHELALKIDKEMIKINSTRVQ